MKRKNLLIVDNTLDTSDREGLLSTIDNYVQDRLQENIERITKLVYETISEKDKLIENLTNEKDTMNEKYRKYKRMAENARNTIKCRL